MGIFKSLVDLAERIEFHDPVNRKSSLAVVLDHLRDEYLGYSVALDDAHDSLSFSHQFSEHIDLHGRGNANDGFYAQRSQAAESLSYKIISLKCSQHVPVRSLYYR